MSVPVLRASIFEPFPEVRFAFSMRRGSAADPESLFSEDDFLRSSGVRPESVAIQKQVHSATVVRVAQPGVYPECDAMVTRTPGLFLRIAAADCLSVFLYDPRTKTVGAIHSGWRGCVGGVLQHAVDTMRRESSSSAADLRVFVGPSARSCCYEIGPEVAALFEPAFLARGRSVRPHLDMQRHTVSVLVNMGVPESSIEVSPYCTICSPGLFHSYRRDGIKAGRNTGVIGLHSD